MMRRSNYFDDFEELFERMNRQFGGMGVEGMSRHDFDVDVADYDDEVVVTADLPGFERDDFDVSIADDVLTIAAERDVEESHEDEAYIRRERRHHSVRRTIPISVAVDEDSAAATYKNGVLTVTLSKTDAESDAHHVDVE